MKENNGITLVALVVTIIVLVILAGISINLLFGKYGIVTRAGQTKEEYTNAQIEEQEYLNYLDKQIADYNKSLPENTKEDPQPTGTIVKVPKEWQTETVKYIKTSDGLETTELTKVATVYAVSVGNGETVPVPNNFYYIGGNLDTGVIISDDVADKYDGQTDKTTYEYTTRLQGNQFVWIPCSTSEYKKCYTWNGKTTQTSETIANTNWDTTTPKSELTQIEKYGGFYVARYEAGLANTITEFTTNQKHTGSNQVYNLDGVPQSKAGIIPWIFIDWEHAKVNAESMYRNNYVSSGLITGTQWDVILNKMVSKNVIKESDLTNSNAWGNYMDNSISYTGRLARADYNSTNSNAWTLKPFGTKTSGTTTKYSSNNGDLLTTGASKETEKYHIYDVAGNIWEWTEEDSHRATSGQYRVCRGSGSEDNSSSAPACYRNGVSASWTSCNIGFRTVLYIK